MKLVNLSTDQLKKSTSNVRAGHSKEDIKSMANSIKHRGLIHPPQVAANGDGRYEIVAGQLRVAGAIAAGLEEIPCHDVSHLSDAERVELSLSENVDRRRSHLRQDQVHRTDPVDFRVRLDELMPRL